MSIDQGGPKRHALGVDFGTSNTVAVARWPDGRARPIIIDGSPLLPSAVYAEPDGQLAVGRDALYSARLEPARFEPNPKRRVDDGTVLLGDREIPVPDLIAAVLERVAEEWRRTVGPAPTDVTLTCPATWGATRRGLLADAATRAGLTGARLVAEPVAAATYFAEVLGRDVPIGSVVVVHDFGAGTFDASVVARTAEGFEVMAVDGRDDIGGLDVDAALVEHLRAEHADAAWQRIVEPTTLAERRAQRQLWDDVRIAKERLSRSQSADLVVPLLDLEIHLTRDELETVARPVLDQTVQVTRRLLRWADLPEGRLAGVFLVGGASRIPLVATLLHRELGEAPVVIEQPELVVAEGSILADEALLASGPAAPGPTAEMRLVIARRNESDTVVVRAVSGHSAETSIVRASEGSLAIPTEVGGGSEPLAASGLTVVVGPAGAVPAGSGSAGAVPAGSGSAAETAVAEPPGEAESRPEPDDLTVVPPRKSVDDQTTVRSRRDGSGLPPAVDPWPHAVPDWEPDPDQTVVAAPGRAGAGAAAGSARTASARTGSPAAPTRPQSPARPTSPAAARPSTTARPSVPAPRREQQAPPRSTGRTAPSRPAGPGPSRRPAPAPRRPKRRPGGFVRFLQILLSVIVLIAVPIAAMILAYSYGTGEPFQEAATQLAKDIVDLYHTHVA